MAAFKSPGAGEEGVVYVPDIYDVQAMDINPDKILNFQNNVYLAGLCRKHINLVFPEPPTVKVYDANNDVDEVVQTAFSRQMDSIYLYERMQQALYGELNWGGQVFNWVWEWIEGEYRITALRPLPGYSFCTPAPGRKVYTPIMQGITMDEKTGEIEYYQTTVSDGKTTKLNPDNVFFHTNIVSGALCAPPFILPLLPFVEMGTFVWNSLMQWVNRAAAPIMFIRITNPQPATKENGWISDFDYAKKVISTWGKDVAYPLRENMEPIFPSFPDNGNLIDVINAITSTMLEYLSPSNLISKDGTLIGGSNKSESDLLSSYIRSVHHRIEQSFKRIGEKYLEGNGYTGYSIEIEIPTREPDRSAIKIEQARVALSSPDPILWRNEIRELLEQEGLDGGELNLMREDWKKSEVTVNNTTFPQVPLTQKDLTVLAPLMEKPVSQEKLTELVTENENEVVDEVQAAINKMTSRILKKIE